MASPEAAVLALATLPFTSTVTVGLEMPEVDSALVTADCTVLLLLPARDACRAPVPAR